MWFAWRPRRTKCMDTASMHERLALNPLAGTALVHHDILCAAEHLVLQARQPACRNDVLRLTAVLLVLYVDEVFEHRQSCVLGLSKRSLYSRVRTLMATDFVEFGLDTEDLVMATAEVDTMGTATRVLLLLVQQSAGARLERELPSASSLKKLHRNLARTDHTSEEAPPHVYWLANLVQSSMLAMPPFVLVAFALSNARPTSHPVLFSRGTGTFFVAVLCAEAACLLLWRLATHRLVLVRPSFADVMKAAALYTMLLVGLDGASPAVEVARVARHRFVNAPLTMSLIYFTYGTTFSLLPTMIRSQQHTALQEGGSDDLLLSTLILLASLIMRSAQCILADDAPFEDYTSGLFWLCARYHMAPFAVGFVVMQPFLLLTRWHWHELKLAQSQTDAANVEVAMVRSHAWAVEAARREERLTLASPAEQPWNSLGTIAEAASARTPIAEVLSASSAHEHASEEHCSTLELLQATIHDPNLVPGTRRKALRSVWQMVHSQLAIRRSFIRLLVWIVLPATWVLLSMGVGPLLLPLLESHTLKQLSAQLPPWFVFLPRASLVCFSTVLLVAIVVLTGCFPQHLHSTEGKALMLPAATEFGVLVLLESLRSFFLTDVGSHVNWVCKAIHALLGTATTLNWAGLTLMVAHGSGTWHVTRTAFLIDGLCFISCTLSMSYYGPPPIYPPKAASFGQSLQRGAVTFLVAMLTGPANRTRIASLANRLGLGSHVTLTLGEMQNASSPHTHDGRGMEGEGVEGWLGTEMSGPCAEIHLDKTRR